MTERVEVRVAKRVFDQLDTDKNGVIDAKELEQGLRMLKLPVSKNIVESIIAAGDKDGDGTIDFNEFCSFVSQREAELQKVFSDIDQDGDGTLSVGEVRRSLELLGVKATAAECSTLVKQMDKDGNGTISFAEFRDFLVLLPSHNIRAIFEVWTKAAAIDIGESMLIPDDTQGMKAPWITLCSGAVAGAVSRSSTAPLDRLKTILQASTESSKYPGLAGGLRSIYSDGGWKSFFRGNGANVLKIAPETAIKFWAFDTFRNLIAKDKDAPTAIERLAAGSSAGVVSQTAIYPLEIAKTRLAASRLGEYSGITGCLRETVSREGFRALYKGLGASLAGIIPYAGVDLALYSGLKETYTNAFPDRNPGTLTLLACGAASSTAGQLVSYPLQLVRTRLQTQGTKGRPVLYSGILDCFRKVVRQDGLTGLYKGLGPNFFKALPAISISYVAFENVKVVLEREAEKGKRA
ncbi:hypothetical protein BSKO_11015 [Bryopsis sp. KO-2023]|nr:hypothetical protein BSKO_11015 [Bryopsis sp. KO-2023]